MVRTDTNEIRDRLERAQIRTVLAVRASRLGDLLMATPVIHAFAERWPETRLIVLTNRYSKDLLAGNEDIDEVLYFDGREADLAGRAGRRLAAGLRTRGVDLLLALRPRKELGSFADRAAIPFLWPPEQDRGKEDEQHVVERCFSRFAALGLMGEPGKLRLRVRDRDLLAADDLIPPGTGPLILIHPGCDETIRWKPRTGVRRRVWPGEHWRSLIDHLSGTARVILSSGSRIESIWVERILEGRRARHVSRLPLDVFPALVRRADVMITVDTGPLHIAAAIGTPLVALYGPSPVEYTGPWKANATVLRRDLPCSPCQGKGVRCLRNVCMEEIFPGEVIAATERLLAGE
ncbi:MAG: glycosyltransferase family 9 protein [Planctomycetota bacterium]